MRIYLHDDLYLQPCEWLKSSHTGDCCRKQTNVIVRSIMDVYSIFSHTFAGDDMLIAYTVSDSTYLIFGGEFDLSKD